MPTVHVRDLLNNYFSIIMKQQERSVMTMADISEQSAIIEENIDYQEEIFEQGKPCV